MCILCTLQKVGSLVSLNKSKTDHLIFSTSSLHDNKYQLLIVGRMVAHSIHRANVCEKDTK